MIYTVVNIVYFVDYILYATTSHYLKILILVIVVNV